MQGTGVRGAKAQVCLGEREHFQRMLIKSISRLKASADKIHRCANRHEFFLRMRFLEWFDACRWATIFIRVNYNNKGKYHVAFPNAFATSIQDA